MTPPVLWLTSPANLVRIPTATPAPLPVPNTLPACHEPEMPSGEGSSLGEEDELVRS